MPIWLALTLIVSVISVAAFAAIRQRRSTATTPHKRLSRDEANCTSEIQSVAAAANPIIPHQTADTKQLSQAIYSLAFGVNRFDYPILGPHGAVLQAAEAAVATVMHQEQYFPRRPALLPKLLHALNTADNTRQEIVRLILQDPVLAGNVLKRANSAYYRLENEPIESIDRAVVLLGSEGLRAPVATAVLQPVFRLPRGFFDFFAPITWELSQRTALAAEAHSRLTRSADPFAAHLVGLLGGLGRLVLFRLTLDKYRLHPSVLPRADVFIRLTENHGQRVTRLIAEAWELSMSSLAALDAQIASQAPLDMSPQARTLYYATLVGETSLLVAHNRLQHEDANAVLTAQGLQTEAREAMWSAASTAN
jgi:HD-like signal output (HDOD) protein